MSPRLQHAVRLLTLSSLDYAQELHQALDRNPFLEADEPQGLVDAPHEPGDATPVDRYGLDAPGSDAEACAPYVADPARADDAAAPWEPADPWGGPRSTGRAADGDEAGGDRLDRWACETTLAEHLHRQLALLRLAPPLRAAAAALIDSLDDDGYLRTPLDALRHLPGLRPRTSLRTLEQALGAVQSLEPTGVGARDVAECLRLQLAARPDAPPLALEIVEQHLPRLAARDVPGLARLLGRTPAEIEAVCTLIRRLDPRPGWRVGPQRVPTLVPDVLVRRQQGRWEVALNPAVLPRVRFNHAVAELFQRCRQREPHGALADHLQQARWTLRNVEQRFSTILDVARAIVRRQSAFLEHGPMALKPLSLREIGDEIGAHESTVSRVTRHKYLATPSGVVELKVFFSRPMATRSGAPCTGPAIRGRVLEMLQAESPGAPLSDAEIARRLAREGLVVARRTVTKYRQWLRIEPVERRRRHDAADRPL
ncbi:RNA polymerase sigma-54 factor RpoN [Piscinibacter sakaiensis]|uniref:RNA polymerase sigma-54 factor n=2 Tax=Piscinibacter sakaiensis TaxID=1547922 RepID=A0A0K8P1L3_PISS1|nr:RNA polymerase sigma-54 factor RpoN [Piscinibacter sakaiensis]